MFLSLKSEDCKDVPVESQRWHVIDARRTVEDIHNEIIAIAEKTLNKVAEEPISTLWMEK